MATSDEMVAALEKLHTPVLGSGATVECRGCPGDYEYGQPAWPCADAEILFTPDERATLLASFEPQIAEYREARAQRRRDIEDHGSPSERIMQRAADALLAAALKPFPDFAGKTVQFELVADLAARDGGGKV